MDIESSFIGRVLDRANLLKAAKYAFNWVRYSIDLPLRRKNLEFQRKGAPDNLPLPPARLTFLVRWRYDIQDYYESGVLGYSCIADVLKTNGFEPERFHSVLDFGCGCARILRHWKRVDGQKLYGVDYNADMVEWCKDALPYAAFEKSGSEGRLGFPDGFFDFVYASSVFTHFDERLQHFWIGELGRILKPGGLLLITTMGETRLAQLSPSELKAFKAGNLIIQYRKYVGTNVCGTYNPREYVIGKLVKGWRLIHFRPGGAKDQNQDVYLLQK
jgi:SAM-dependent methyltransferase